MMELMTISEVAERLRVSQKTIYYWVKRDSIPFIKIGKHLRFRMDHVMAHFEERTEAMKPSCLSLPSLLKSKGRSLTIRKGDLAPWKE